MRLIDADNIRFCGLQNTACPNETAQHIIDIQPTITSDSLVKRGEWVFTGEETVCSICNTGKPTKTLDHKIRNFEIKYCIFCGAKMVEDAQ